MDDLFTTMEEGHDAEWEIRARLEDIIGESQVMGMGYDFYDSSLEIYVMDWTGTTLTKSDPAAHPAQNPAFVLTREQAAAIFERTGCARFWVNFKDGTEQYCACQYEYPPGTVVPMHVGERRKASYNRWERFNEGPDPTHKLKVKMAHLQRQLSEQSHRMQ